jgi:Tol biopolymer transport system component
MRILRFTLLLIFMIVVGWYDFPACASTFPGDEDFAFQVSVNTADDRWPGWSPDGQHIAFHSQRSGKADIWMIDPDGSNPTNLTADVSGANYGFSWSPDSTQIVFTSQIIGTADTSVWIAAIDGSHTTNLAATMGLDDSPTGFAAWSPDGAYISFNKEGRRRLDVHVVDLTNLAVTNLTHEIRLINQESVWSPNSQFVAVRSILGTDSMLPQIWVLALDGSSTVEVTADIPDLVGPDHNVISIYSLDWSPVDDVIVFSASINGQGNKIFTVKADGTELKNLTPGTDSVGRGKPVWSPDGSQIAFHSLDASDTSERIVSDIWMMDANGSNPVNLTASPEILEIWPAWSPDGSQIAFHSDASGDLDIWVMNADGSNARNLTGNAQ